MQILRAFQIIKQDGMYKANIIYNTVENGVITKANNRQTMYITDLEVASCVEGIDKFLTDLINAE